MTCYHHHTHACACHIDTSTLADGTYELVPKSESEPREAQVNLTEATEDLNQNSEEPKASSAQEGKLRSITQYFYLLCNLLLFLSTGAFKL